MRRLGRIAYVAGVVVTLVVLVTCNNGLQLADPNAFDLDQFEANIVGAFQNYTVGYAYAISSNGTLVRSGAAGSGRTPIDGQTDMSIHNRMHIASISKTITTAAVLRLLEDTPGVDVDDSVAPYLPPTWVQGAGIDNLTFRELLSHKSGLNDKGPQTSGATSYDNLKSYVSQGATLPKTAFIAYLRFSEDIINAQSRAGYIPGKNRRLEV